MPAPETRHLTILLTDIKGFTDKTSSQTRAAIQDMLDEHRAIVLPILQNGGGQLVKTIGDAFLMTFASPTNAVLTGVAVQEALAKRNEGRAADDKLEIRIAINAGEVNIADNDVFGEAVNITARIEGIAEANQVYFTEAVYLAMNKNEVPSSEVGLMQLKGIPEKIRVYKVRREDPVGAASAAASDRQGLKRFLPSMSDASAAPTAFGPGVKAIPAASAATAPPKSWRRAVALGIDALICSIVLGAFTGRDGSRNHFFVRSSANKDAPAAGTTIAIGDSAGARNKPQQVVYDNKKGLRIVVPENIDIGADDDGTLERGIKSGKWAFALIWAVYNLAFLKWLGSSPGKMVMKLRVVAQNGSPLDKRQRWMRALFSLVSLYTMFLGYLWALWEPQRRTWHDLVAGTRVVTAE